MEVKVFRGPCSFGPPTQFVLLSYKKQMKTFVIQKIVFHQHMGHFLDPDLYVCPGFPSIKFMLSMDVLFLQYV